MQLYSKADYIVIVLLTVLLASLLLIRRAALVDAEARTAVPVHGQVECAD